MTAEQALERIAQIVSIRSANPPASWYCKLSEIGDVIEEYHGD